MDEMNKQSSNRLLWIMMGAGTAVAVSLCLGLAGFAIGRATAVTETITETQIETMEVTREIVVTVVSESIVTAEAPVSAEAPASPTAQPTAVPEGGVKDIIGGQASPDGTDFSLFDEAWEIIERNYDGDLPEEDDVLHSAISGSIESLGDDYTRFIPPDVAARFREDMDGSISGIGAFVRENEEGFFEIVAPITGQPADFAGLQPGDIVYTVDGESVVGMSFDEVILLVRGPSGTTVVLTVLREGEQEPLEFSIVRATFEVPVVEFEMLPDDIAYVHLLEFNQSAELKVLEALAELLPQNPQGLIFDLRNNPGGFLDQSVAISDIFLPQSVVLYERNHSGLDRTFHADDGDVAETIPLVVLVNDASASASEIVAGAIQDNDRGTIIGATSFGKGSVQMIHTLSDGSELRVTIARWYTPDNNSISGEGITPDIEVESPEEFGGEDDGQLQRAIEYILTGQ